MSRDRVPAVARCRLQPQAWQVVGYLLSVVMNRSFISGLHGNLLLKMYFRFLHVFGRFGILCIRGGP